ncbi:MAG: cation transporter [Hyphomicrobiaceae bacterium]
MADVALRRTIAVVALLNLAYFGVEFAVATAIGSVALFADSIDFLEDASVNLLILLALGWSAAKRRLVGIALAGLLLVPGLAALWTVAEKLMTSGGGFPDPTLLSLAGGGALVVNATAAYLLARVRHHGGSLTLAAFLSARNDVLANIGIIAAGFATAATLSIWPDVIVGTAIALLNIGAAKEVYEAAVEGGGCSEAAP